MEYKKKFTNVPIYPLGYAGFWEIQTTPFYSENENLLDQADSENAPYNALLFAHAPKMFEELEHCVNVLKLMSTPIASDIISRIESLLKEATTLPND